MKMIYLVMSQTGTWLSRLIRVYTGEEYNHISISLDDTFERMYSFGRREPDNPFSGGFVLENIQDGVYKLFEESKCIVYKLEITNAQYNRLEKILIEFTHNKDSYRYNFLGLFFVVANVQVSRKNSYFCSQFVSDVIGKSGIYDFKKPSSLVTVKDFLDIPQIKPIFEGYTHTIQRPVVL